MKNRKPWELTDEELDAVPSEPVSLDRAIATAAARKAMEWAAGAGDHNWPSLKLRALLHEELSDG